MVGINFSSKSCIFVIVYREKHLKSIIDLIKTYKRANTMQFACNIDEFSPLELREFLENSREFPKFLVNFSISRNRKIFENLTTQIRSKNQDLKNPQIFRPKIFQMLQKWSYEVPCACQWHKTSNPDWPKQIIVHRIIFVAFEKNLVGKSEGFRATLFYF